MIDRTLYNPSPYNDDWEDQPSQGWFYKWVPGVALPLLLGSLSTYAIFTQQATLADRFGIVLNLRGSNAAAIGVAWLSASLFLHCHYFWGNIYDQAWFAVLGKIIGAIGFIAGLVYVLIRFGVLGIR